MTLRTLTIVLLLGMAALSIRAEISPGSDKNGMSDEARDYLDEAMSIVKENSLFMYETDWALVSSEVYRLADGAKSTEDTYVAIAAGLSLVDDHSFLRSPDFEPIRPPDYEKTERPEFPSDPLALLLDGQVAYLRIPYHSPKQPEESEEYAENLQSLMTEIDGDDTCGWILDLRANVGGNMWPMVEAVASLLETNDTGRLGAFILPDVEAPVWWGFRAGQGYIGDGNLGDSDLPNYVVKDYSVRRPSAPVAILIGNWTASSGEFLAVAFLGRPKTALFGQNSAGYLTANENFDLSDGATIWLATARAIDRRGMKTGKHLEPDFETQQQPLETSVEDDQTIKAAKVWITEHAACH